jgi:hypothetical protein
MKWVWGGNEREHELNLYLTNYVIFKNMYFFLLLEKMFFIFRKMLSIFRKNKYF